MAKFENPEMITINAEEPIPIDADQNEILEALQNNAKDPQKGYNIYTKFYKSTQSRYGNNQCKADLVFGTVEYMRNLIGLTKEEAMVVVGATYDLRQGKETWTYADNP